MEGFHTASEMYRRFAIVASMDAKKLSISLDEKLLNSVDKHRKTTGETRSGLIARLLRCWLEKRAYLPEKKDRRD